MGFYVLIPARYGSKRLPGKPLINICGKPMVEHVWRRAMQSEAEKVFIVTDDSRIYSKAKKFGARVLLTDSNHSSGTDRLAEASSLLDLEEDKIVVNVQGDEPLISPLSITRVAKILDQYPKADMGSLCSIITDKALAIDFNKVKVVVNEAGRALYFSRSLIPFSNKGPWYHHIGLYSYRSAFLKKFSAWLPTPLEKLERLEQLRAIENGAFVYVSITSEEHSTGVDTANDLELIRSQIKIQSND